MNSSDNSAEQRPKTLQAVLLTNTGNVPLRVLSLGRTRALVRTGQPVRLPPKVRVGFAHHGRYPGRILMLATVASLQDQQESTMLKLDYEALHSMDGKDSLTEFVTRDLGREEVAESAFSFGRGGWFYRLDATPGSAPIDVNEADGASQRREERIPVRVPLSYQHEGQALAGQAYNVSFHGIFILTEAALPPRGEAVIVRFPLLVDYQTKQVNFTGIVCWTGSGMSSADGGGMGIEITAWASWITLM